MQRAKEAGDSESWLGLVSSYCNQLKSSDDENKLVAEFVAQSNLVRAKSRTRTGRLWAAQQIKGLVPSSLFESCLLNHSDLSTAFQLTEACRARLLLDMMSNLYKPPGPAMISQAAELEARIFAYEPGTDQSLVMQEMELMSLLPLINRGSANRARLDDVNHLEALAVEGDWGFSGVATSPSLADIQKMLRPAEALIEYVELRLHDGRPSYIALVVTGQRAQAVRLPVDLLSHDLVATIEVDGRQPIDSTALGNAVANLRLAISDGSDEAALPILRVLYEYLLKPLAEIDGMESVDHLVIVPTGFLHLIPWMALWAAANDPSVQQRAVSLIPSAAIWALVVSHSDRLPSSYMGMGDPKLQDRNLPRLKEAGREVKEFAERLGGWHVEVRTQQDATKAEFLSLAPTAGVVHVATHGDFPEMNPLDEHAFLLTPAPGDDGRLTASQIAPMDLRWLGVALLNVCNGAVYRVGPGDEPYGLAAAMMTAGAQNIIAPLWPIADDFARGAAVSLADDIISKTTLATAFTFAMNRLAVNAGMVDWAAYCLIGPGRELEWQ